MNTSPGIKAEDKVPAIQKVAYSGGYCIEYLATGLTASVLWLPFFNIGLGFSPAILATIMVGLRVLDAFLDPVIGNLSDNTRTRWGRRRPFVLVGTLVTAASYLALWHVPGVEESEFSVLILACSGGLLYTAFTIFTVPFESLRMELTPDYDERTRLSAWVAVAGKCVYFAGGWVLAIASSSYFSNTESGEADLVSGMRTLSWFIAGLIVVLGVTASFVVKERYYLTTAVKQSSDPFLRSICESLSCRPLWNLIGIGCFIGMGISVSNTVGQYVNIYYINGGDKETAFIISGWKSTFVMIFGFVGIPLWTKLSEYFDKKTIVFFMLLGSSVGHLLNLVCLQPSMPYLQLVPAVFEMGALGGIWMFLPSMKADVADYDEQTTFKRREGSLNAVSSWFGKAGIVLGAGMGGWVIQLAGFDVSLESQSVESLNRLRWLFIALPIVAWGLSLFCIGKYPLTRTRLKSIRDELESRRGKV